MYGPVPLLISTIIFPLLLPLQSIGVNFGEEPVNCGEGELPIVVVVVFVHAFTSVIVTVYVEGESVFAVAPAAELLHEYVSVPVPPVAVIETLPLLLPQVALFIVVLCTEISVG